MIQEDLFPETLVQVYSSNTCFDLSEPPIEMENPSSKFTQNLADRIAFLKALPKGRYYIFANHGGMPYIYDKEKNRKMSPDHTQRMYTSIKIEKKSQYFHVLVAMFFLENDDPHVKIQVDHLNMCSTDYRVENLEWVSQSENINRANQRRNRATT